MNIHTNKSDLTNQNAQHTSINNPTSSKLSVSNTTINNLNMNNNQQKTSYSNVLKNTTNIQYPKKDQAIILNAAENVKVREYIYAIGEIIKPKNIIAASRLSNNRICIYLSSKEMVDNLLQQQDSVLIHDHNISIRRLITPAKKIIVSNIPPTVPNNVIEENLKEYNIKLVSPVYFMNAGLKETEYTHILCFRRYLYAVLDDNTILPESILINFENEDLRIFLAIDVVKCLQCNEEGHYSKNCTNPPPEVLHTEIPQTRKRPPPSSTTEVSSITQNQENKDDDEILTPDDTPALTMQVVADVHTAPPETEKEKLVTNNIKQDITVIKPPKKKKKKNPKSKINVEEMLKPIKNHMEREPPIYKIKYVTLQTFLEEAKTTENLVKLTQEYTDNPEEIICVLKDLYKMSDSPQHKGQITRLIRKMEKQYTDQIATEYESSQTMDDSLISD